VSKPINPGVAADQHRQYFLQHIANKQHKREHSHRQNQRGEDLAGQINVQGFQGAVECGLRRHVYWNSPAKSTGESAEPPPD
jgi:hypothetical protein